MTELLRCDALVAGRAGRPVVQDVSLAVSEGEVLSVLGSNGAGKTTLLLTLAGLLPILGGELRFLGLPLSSRRPHRNVRAGIVLVPDDRALFRGLTVRQTLTLARRRRGQPMERILDQFPALHHRLDVAAGALSGGEQQMLALGRALIQQPRVLLVDELSLGLAPVIVRDLLPALAQATRNDGTALVLVEQHVSLALEIADRAIVLSHGRVALDEPAAALRADLRRVEAAYFASDGASV